MSLLYIEYYLAVIFLHSHPSFYHLHYMQVVNARLTNYPHSAFYH